jgi:phospholipase C
MHPHEIFPTDNEPAAGLDCDAANAQINDVHEMIIIQPADQAFQRYFETLILTLILG